MEATEVISVRELLRERSSFGKAEVGILTKLVGGAMVSDVRREVQGLQTEIDQSDRPEKSLLVRLGIGLHLLGAQGLADRYLSEVPDDPVASFHHALVLTALERHNAAGQKFEEAARLGYDSIECSLQRAGSLRMSGRLDEAESMLRSTAPEGARRAEYSYQMGCILADRGDTFGAIEYFERAVDMDPRHSRALFALAGEQCRHGNDEEAIRLYERAMSKPPYYLGAMLNLGLLYEDAENYSAAAFCFRRILEADHNHAQARLYLKDIEAAEDMYYDEDAVREESRLSHLLNRPVTDFELTVRSRNCLESLGITSLGDLTSISEQELLAGKNFGETSLREVRELMAMHGLRIGQNFHVASARPALEELEALSPEERSLMEKPISELDFSVRSRKCMSRLGIHTVGDLVQRSPDDLLTTKNFGVTSLNEIRAKLDELGLKLKND